VADPYPIAFVQQMRAQGDDSLARAQAGVNECHLLLQLCDMHAPEPDGRISIADNPDPW